MKEKIKFFVVITLILMLSVSSTTHAKTHEDATQEEIIYFLKSIGSPDEALANYNPKEIDDL